MLSCKTFIGSSFGVLLSHMLALLASQDVKQRYLRKWWEGNYT